MPIRLLLVLTILLSGCGTPGVPSTTPGVPNTAATATASKEPVPKCDDYVTRLANINLDLDKIKEHRFSIGLSVEQVSRFETLQTAYNFQLRALCQNASMYTNNEDGIREYRCRLERLSASQDQLNVINIAIAALKSDKEAAAQGETIRAAVDHYFKAFMTTQPCHAVPTVKQISQIQRKLDVIHSVLGALIKQELVSYRETGPFDTTSFQISVTKGLSSEEGFQAKADLLLMEFYYEESARVAKDPRLLSEMNGQIGQRLKRYRAGKAPDAVRLKELASAILRQREAAKRVLQDNVTFRKSLSDVLVTSGAAEKKRILGQALDALAGDPELRTSPSFQNLLGTMALSLGDRERALKHFCESYLLDKEHLPVYDSLSYALWRLNGDAFTARLYAQQGMTMAAELQIRVGDARAKTFAHLDAIGKSAGQKPILNRYRSEMESFYKTRGPIVDEYLANFSDRLTNNTAYYGAVEQSNKEATQRMASQVLNRTPKNMVDPDYLDTFGFAKLRYATDQEGIEEALSILNKAAEAATTQEQKRLTNEHIALAYRMKELRKALATELQLD